MSIGATLIISRIGAKRRRFILQQVGEGGAFMPQADTTNADEDQASQAFFEFAECIKGRHADEPSFKHLGQVLFAVMLPPRLQEHLTQMAGPLTILTDDSTVPWELLHDGTEFLCLRQPVARQLAVAQTVGAEFSGATGSGFSALVIADPTAELPGAEEEGDALFRLLSQYGLCERLVGDDATFTNVMTKLVSTSYSVIHYCGHLEYDAPRRLSSIPLARKGRLHTGSVGPAFRGRPLVFLNACYSDIATRVAGDAKPTESFARAFLVGNSRGAAAAVVGSMWRIPDEPEEAGREFVLAFYKHLLEGGAVGQALLASRLMARSREWGPMFWGPYVLYGQPMLEPFPGGLVPSAAKGAPPHRAAETEDLPGAAEAGATRKPETAAPPPRGAVSEMDSDAEKVFAIALQEMSALGQTTLTSMHVLIGLCQVGGLPERLKANRVDPEKLIAAARQRVKALVPPDSDDVGVSPNVVRLLAVARRRATSRGRRGITPDDLLGGLLECEDAEALRILSEKFGLRRDVLAPRLSEPTSRWQFDPATHEAIQHAAKRAKTARVGFVGTPHLLIGLIRTGGLRAITLLRDRGVNLEELCDVLERGVGEGDRGAKNGTAVSGPTLTARSARVFERAQALAGQDARGEIGEAHLLQAILEQEGYTADVLSRFGAPPEKLLTALSRPKGPLAQ